LPTHHGKPPPPKSLKTTESLFAKNHEPFFNTIDPTATWARCENHFFGARNPLDFYSCP
jgi:hypothetical protein